MTDGPLQHFACPVCGRIRPLAKDAARRIEAGGSGECAPGYGCRQALDPLERDYRFWLEHVGITKLQIRAAGGAVAYVLEFGLPDELAAMASAWPEHTPIHEQWRRPSRARRVRAA
jgi:hypothetical protein